MAHESKRPLTVKMAAMARDVSACGVGSIKDGTFFTQWVGTLDGHPVMWRDTEKHDTKEAAIEAAQNVQNACRQQIAEYPPQEPVKIERVIPALFTFDSATVTISCGEVTVLIGYAQRRHRKNRPYCRIYVHLNGIEIGHGWLEVDFSRMSIEWNPPGMKAYDISHCWEAIAQIAERTSDARNEHLLCLIAEMHAEFEAKKATKKRSK